MHRAPSPLLFARRSGRCARSAVLLGTLSALLLGCGDDAAPAPDGGAPMPDADAAPDIAPACHPLGFQACLMPWPSAAYLSAADTATGVRVDLPAEAMPTSSAGVRADPAPFARFDGFAPSGPILLAFPDGVAAEGLPGPGQAEASLAADAPIVLVDMDRGERVAYFAQVDANAIFPEDQVLIIRPLARLTPATRYAVAVRDTLRAPGGEPLPRPAGFEALLAGTEPASGHPRLAALAARHPEVVAALAEHGVQAEELLLAWDFVTASDEFLRADLLHMRDQTQDALAELEQRCSLVEESVDDPTVTRSFLSGSCSAPDFLTAGEAAASVLRRDAQGLPEYAGLRDAPVSVVVPACVSEQPLPRPLLVFGHGLFGSAASDMRRPSLLALANDACLVLAGGDFIGLSERQLELATSAATDIASAVRVTEKLAQSLVDFQAITAAARGALREEALLQVDGASVIDPDQVYYYGASLGGIMGLTLMAYEPTLPRGVFGVPGGAWSLLLERSVAWGPLQAVANSAYPSPFDYQMLLAFLAMHFEPYDPITTAATLTGTPLPDTPSKQVLLYEAVGDSVVSNLSTEMVARTMELPVLAPSVRVPDQMAEQSGPLASALVIYDEHPTPLPPEDNRPPAQDNGTHLTVHTRAALVRQITAFLSGAAVVATCGGDAAPAPCDCATNACE
ncbi:alpha/beta hydrolase family protein [Haliangium ochraceum]|uniref:Uncharacterized protein n=1 Tax=Haliangium ochraceum (strain DSM 14365 / JCM 11303 / SMP-2) TaxID=502025 RepID=D0LU27_HALO1|nr:hypothetical protein [Haliangium ochraceum]ACY17391.1 conserved hypothetical protein [Haliangium ochraceum DSM 14365]